MAWIESHQSLGLHPKTITAAKLLHLPLAHVVGMLQFLWWWALDYSQDGCLGVSELQLATICRYGGKPEKLFRALRDCGPHGRAGFIEVHEDGTLWLHDWMDYAGRLIEARAEDAERKRARRAEVRRTSAGHPTDVGSTQPTVPNQQTQPNQSRTRRLPVPKTQEFRTPNLESGTPLGDVIQQVEKLRKLRSEIDKDK